MFYKGQVRGIVRPWGILTYFRYGYSDVIVLAPDDANEGGVRNALESCRPPRQVKTSSLWRYKHRPPCRPTSNANGKGRRRPLF